MEFGSFMEFHMRPQGGDAAAFEEAMAHVDQAEAQGLHAVWLAETHFSAERSPLSAPLIVAAAIAGRTRRMKIGTAVHLLPLGNPLRMAEEVATLDQLSLGRLEYGVGRSGVPGSYEGYGIDYLESRDRFFEALDIMIQAWTQERFSYQGRFNSYDNVRLVPKPYQQPHPPVRVAAITDDTFPKLAQMGLPVFVGLRSLSQPRVAEQVRSYKQAWKEAGQTGRVDVQLRLPVYVAETREHAISDPEKSFMRQFTRLGNQVASTIASEGADRAAARAERAEQLQSMDWEQVLREKVAVGTPEMVIDRLQELREDLNLTGIVAEFNAGEQLPREAIESSLRLFCEKVMPAFE